MNAANVVLLFKELNKIASKLDLHQINQKENVNNVYFTNVSADFLELNSIKQLDYIRVSNEHVSYLKKYKVQTLRRNKRRRDVITFPFGRCIVIVRPQRRSWTILMNATPTCRLL